MRRPTFLRSRSAWALALAPAMAVAGIWMAVPGQAAVTGPAAMTASQAVPAATSANEVKPNAVNQMDCNGFSTKYKSLRSGSKMDCTDPFLREQATVNGKKVTKTERFEDNGHYIGHDEPSVKFISNKAGSGNTMTYFMKLPVDPSKRPTADGSVTKYGELSIAPWFGLPMCDPHSYPQNPCTPDSDSNTGLGAATDAGSAFMELQLYPPGFAPFPDNVSCSRTKWCAAMTIDSLEGTFNFAFLNPACEEPQTFAYLQRNGVPAGPPSPQLSNISSETPNGQTLEMHPGDVLEMSITDPAAGFTTTIKDLTTHQTGTMVASAANGFMDTDVNTCAGIPFTYHAEYSTAAPQNQVPWAALEGGVLMQQEIGHFESCNSVSNSLPVSIDNGGSEGPDATGQGPCDPTTFLCDNSTTEGVNGPVACPTNDASTGALCEFSDAACFPKGNRPVTINGTLVEEHYPIAGCLDNVFQNGDLDFDGTSYQANTWPDGTGNHPTAFRYIGPFTTGGKPYPQIQFETDAPASESLCDTATGTDCVLKPLGSDFYPFFSLNNTQRLSGVGAPRGACVWNFGNVLPGVTNQTFGKDAQYGASDVARFGGTNASAVIANPAISGHCPSFKQP
jgi:hypothetical protein